MLGAVRTKVKTARSDTGRGRRIPTRSEEATRTARVLVLLQLQRTDLLQRTDRLLLRGEVALAARALGHLGGNRRVKLHTQTQETYFSLTPDL